MNYQNALTNSVYSAGNQEILEGAAQGNEFQSELVAGFNQWKELGRVVSKGQKATKICMFVDKKIGDEAKMKKGDDTKKKKVMKYAAVFFEDQTEVLKETESA